MSTLCRELLPILQFYLFFYNIFFLKLGTSLGDALRKTSQLNRDFRLHRGPKLLVYELMKGIWPDVVNEDRRPYVKKCPAIIDVRSSEVHVQAAEVMPRSRQVTVNGIVNLTTVAPAVNASAMDMTDEIDVQEFN